MSYNMRLRYCIFINRSKNIVYLFESAFYIVSIEVPKEKREFSIAVTSIADSFGIALAGFTGNYRYFIWV